MKIKNMSIILLVLFFILLLMIINNKKHTIETFASNTEKSNPWTTNKDVLNAENQPLNDIQKEEVKDMVKSLTSSQLKTLIQTQSPLLVGPQGHQGPPGPAGTTLIASGRLINKKGSYNSSNDSFFFPKYVVTRTEGTNKESSLSYLENLNPFASYQNWQLDVNNNLVNRYDNNCLTMNQTTNKLYIDKCNNEPTQKWSWDNSNRLISTSSSTSNKLKCIGLTKPETNILTTNLPGCSGKNCMNDTPRQYLTVKDCDINSIKDDELWTFV
jgi:hypothetical protein